MSILDPHPILFSWATGSITAHGAFFALGALVAAVYFARTLADCGIYRFVEGFEQAVLIFIVGLVGARFGYLVTYIHEWANFLQLFAIWQGGLVSFWGIGASLAYAAWRGHHLVPAQRQVWWRAVLLAGLLGWAVGRLGNYYMADSYGVTSGVWHLFYGRVPIQLFESAWCLILFFALRRRADAAWLSIVGYLAGRFIIDIWRDESQLGPLHLSQWFALLVLLVLIPMYVRRRTHQPAS